MAFDTHVTVGGGHFDSYGNQGYPDNVVVGGGHGAYNADSGRYSYDNDPLDISRMATASIYNSTIPTIKINNDDSRAWSEREVAFRDKNWQDTKDLAKESALAIGSLKSGDTQAFYEHSIEAARKSYDIFVDGLGHTWGDMQEIFGGTSNNQPDNDHSRPDNERN